jgi:hypothetical protein
MREHRHWKNEREDSLRGNLFVQIPADVWQRTNRARKFQEILDLVGGAAKKESQPHTLSPEQ